MSHRFVQVFNSLGFDFYMVKFCTISPIDFQLSSNLVLYLVSACLSYEVLFSWVLGSLLVYC